MTFGVGEPSVTLGLWGAAVSGKTSYIAAVDHAARALRERFPSAQLRVTAAEAAKQESNLLFLQYQDELSHGRFPRFTDEMATFALYVTGDIPAALLDNGATAESPTMRPVSLTISLRDYPGKAFQVNRESIFADVGEFLAACDGIILLFDPVREAEAGDNSSFILRPLAELDQRMRGSGKLLSVAEATNRLPQWLAICITKLDDPLVYEQVKLLAHNEADGLIARGAEALPRQLRDAVGATQFAENVTRYFLPSRIRFFLTSTIGLYVTPGGQAPTSSDYMNTVETYGGPRIRGQCRPINVIEPLLWLNQQIGRLSESR